MESIVNIIDTAASYIKTIGIADAIDILIVAYLIFQASIFVRKTNSRNLARGIILIIIVLIVSTLFRLTMISFLIRKAMELGLIAIVILFQPELRRVLERVGSSFSSSRSLSTPVLESAISQTVSACKDMSASKTGALIIFERAVDLGTIVSTGTTVNADVNSELLKNLFFNKAPLHDGAVIIHDARIQAAGCVLPLTQSQNLSKDLGMRHRAGIGLSEQSDAVVIIVSEETGAISMAIDGMLKRHLTPAALTQLLHSELIVEQEPKTAKERIMEALQRLIKRNANDAEKTEKNDI
ncbi:MAG: diadenylate cyclase CdaA [Oscillospiraceae bacterium]|nr:diadenylate cyclase CdaA [Oscillospiraceae bacterium]MBR0393070.1 diadenylate cyclase CdaA [Oscillospiraceae bacterium]